MYKYRFLNIASLLCLLFLSACSTNAPIVNDRYFFPPLPAEPKIEYVKTYFSDHDLKPPQKSFLTEYVLGENPPLALFSSPMDVASDGKGRVFVADSGAREVFVFDVVNHSIRYLSETMSDRGFVSPFSVTFADDGRLYVSDLTTKSVEVFNSNEEHLFTLSGPEILRPTAVAVDIRNELIYVLDTANHRLSLFSLQGDLIGHFGERGDGPGEFNFPTDVDIDEQGNIYVLDTLNARVQVFDEKRKFLRMFGERGSAEGSFQVPKNIAVSKEGHVYVTDALGHKMVIFDREGELLLRLGGKSVFKKGVSPGGFYLPRGVDVDMNGTIWVVDSMNRMMHRFQYLTPEYLRENPVSQEFNQAP